MKFSFTLLKVMVLTLPAICPREVCYAEDPTLLAASEVKGDPIAWFGLMVSARHQGFFGQPKPPFVVTGVSYSSPADRAGIQMLDEIVEIDGDRQLSFDDIGRHLYRASVRDRIKIAVRRRGVGDEIVVHLQAQPMESMHRKSGHVGYETWQQCIVWGVLVSSALKVDVDLNKPKHQWPADVARSCVLVWNKSRLILGEIPGKGIRVGIDASTRKQDTILQEALVPIGAKIRLLESGEYVVDLSRAEAAIEKPDLSPKIERPNK